MWKRCTNAHCFLPHILRFKDSGKRACSPFYLFFLSAENPYFAMLTSCTLYTMSECFEKRCAQCFFPSSSEILFCRFICVLRTERERKRARNSDLVAFLVDVYSLTFFLCSFCWLLNSFLIFNALKLVEGILFIIADVIPSNGSSTIPHILLRYILSVICMHNICLA